MDPIEVEKLRAMAKYKKKSHFLHKIGIYLLSTIMVGLFLSCPLWIPQLCCSIKSLVLESLPKLFSYFFCPKFLFVVSNIIVLILVGESRFLAATKSKTTVDIYDEYVKRQKGCHKLSTTPAANEEFHCHEEKALVELAVVETITSQNREMEREELSEEEEDDDDDDDDDDDEKELQTREDTDDFEVENEYEEEEEEECGLPVDELNKRVEDFIARFNRLRRQEAELLIGKG